MQAKQLQFLLLRIDWQGLLLLNISGIITTAIYNLQQILLSFHYFIPV
jgi:hypothetical protein